MKDSTEYINYQDPLTVAKALEKAAQVREEKQIAEQKRIEEMSTHDEFAKDDDVVIHEGKLISLKRFKDDVKEVAKDYECGIQIEKYNDLKENDIIEAFVMKEIKR